MTSAMRENPPKGFHVQSLEKDGRRYEYYGLSFRFDGKQRSKTFGAVHSTPREEAIAKAWKFLDLLDDGINPQALKRQQREQDAAKKEQEKGRMKFAAAFERRKPLSPTTVITPQDRTDIDRIHNYASHLGGLWVDQIDRVVRRDLVRSMAAEGLGEQAIWRADRTILQTLRWANAEGLAVPYLASFKEVTEELDFKKPKKKRKAPPYSEVPEIFAATRAKFGDTIIHALELIILTAQRGAQVRELPRVGELKLEGPYPMWIVPEGRHKEGETNGMLELPLSIASVEVIKDQLNLIGDSPVVFPGYFGARHTSGGGVLKELRRLENGRWKNYDVHGVGRACFASWARDQGYPLALIRHCSGRKVYSITDLSYIRDNLRNIDESNIWIDAARKLMEHWAQFCLSRVTSQTSSQPNVVALPRRTGGSSPMGAKAMTPAERMRRHRAKKGAL
jgi:hypothetical protein